MRGYSPTYQEIADHLGRRKATAFEHVQALRRKGLVTVGEPYRPRGLRPTGRWSPPADLKPVDELIGLRWQRDLLASAEDEGRGSLSGSVPIALVAAIGSIVRTVTCIA